MTAICAAYGITHDVGFGVLLWQNEVLVGGFGRCAARQSTEAALKDAQVVVHGARAPTKAKERYLNHSALTAFFEDRGWNGSACYAKHAKVVGQLVGLATMARYVYRGAAVVLAADYFPTACLGRLDRVSRRVHNSVLELVLRRRARSRAPSAARRPRARSRAPRRARRARATRPTIGRIDVDAAEMERRDASPDGRLRRGAGPSAISRAKDGPERNA